MQKSSGELSNINTLKKSNPSLKADTQKQAAKRKALEEETEGKSIAKSFFGCQFEEHYK